MGVVHIVSGKTMRGAENQVYLQIEHQSADKSWKQGGVFSKNADIIKKAGAHCQVLFGRLSILNLLLGYRTAKQFPIADYEIIHANCSKSLSFAILLKFLRGGKIIMSRRTIHPIKSTWKYRFVSKIVTCSEAVKAEVEKAESIKQDIEVVYDSVAKGADLNSVDLTGDRYVLCGAALAPEKGLFDLLDGWKVMKSEYDLEHKLFIAGDGVLKDKLIEYVAVENIPEVRFLGWVDDLSSVIMGADACVLCSSSEGLGSFLCESASLGKPLCGTNVGGLGEVINHGANGYLHERGDKKAFANNLSKILLDKALSKGMSSRSKEIATEKFSIEENINKIVKIYKEA